MNTTSLFDDEIFETEENVYGELEETFLVRNFMNGSYMNDIIAYIENHRNVIEDTINNKDKNLRMTISETMYGIYTCFLDELFGEDDSIHKVICVVGRDGIFEKQGFKAKEIFQVTKKYLADSRQYAIQNFTSKYKRMNQ